MRALTEVATALGGLAVASAVACGCANPEVANGTVRGVDGAPASAQVHRVSHAAALRRFGAPAFTAVRGHRYTLLVTGLDRDPHSLVRDRRTDCHADAIMVLTAVAGSGRVDALHIPRDTRVVVVGWGPMKLSSVSQRVGMAAYRQVVARLCGFSLDDALTLDFVRFRQMVCAVGAVPFDVDRPILDRELGVDLGQGRRWL
ncbi:MAG: LCP family protein, partial [Firmicutes bacterium]|nr:LCP family protein [Bacillota bacterium]